MNKYCQSVWPEKQPEARLYVNESDLSILTMNGFKVISWEPSANQLAVDYLNMWRLTRKTIQLSKIIIIIIEWQNSSLGRMFATGAAGLAPAIRNIYLYIAIVSL